MMGAAIVVVISTALLQSKGLYNINVQDFGAEYVTAISLPSWSAGALSNSTTPSSHGIERTVKHKSPIDEKIDRTLQTLAQHKLRYYMYEDEGFRQVGGKYLPAWKLYKEFVETEEQLIELMAAHPLRTRNANEADFFMIPFSITHQMTHSMGKGLDVVFNILYNKTHYQERKGHDHILLSQNPNIFHYSYVGYYRAARLTHQYPWIWNVTVARSIDQESCRFAYDSGLAEENIDFAEVMKTCGVPMSRSAFSTGFVPQIGHLPLLKPSYERFINSSLFLFYHTRVEPSFCNSTIFRKALVEESIMKALPNSSLGFDMNPHEWLQEYTNSRFCMVIRGDNPTSRAHLRTVKVGCIPVIVSDMLPYYAPAFKSTINVSDYSIFIDERTFIADPMKALSTLSAMTEEEIREKVKALAFAQRLLIPDHPESLFVPTFLREAYVARSRKLNMSRYPYKTVGVWRVP